MSPSGLGHGLVTADEAHEVFSITDADLLDFVDAGLRPIGRWWPDEAAHNEQPGMPVYEITDIRRALLRTR